MTGVLNMRTKEDPREEGIRQIKEIGGEFDSEC